MFRRIQLSAFLAVGGFVFLAAVAGEPTGPGKKDVRPDAPVASAPAGARPASAHQNYTETLVNPEDATKVTFDMIAVPGGTFEMGSPLSEQDRAEDEGPPVKVRLKAFWVGKCEVSWDEFDLYFRVGNQNLKEEAEGAGGDGEKKEGGGAGLAAGGKNGGAGPAGKGPTVKDDKPLSPADAVSKPTKPYVDETYGFEREKHPAICMTHHAAMKYCEWLSKKTGKDYRLPTEAEWEYACRAGTTTPYAVPTGEKLTDYAWYKQNSRKEGRLSPHAIGTRKPNAWGLHDMHGNVMEWCLDHYAKDYYGRFPLDKPALMPVNLPSDKRWSHVARGGSWVDQAERLRSAARRPSDKSWMKHDPQEPQSIWWLTRFDVIGLRVVCGVDDPPELRNLKSKVTKESE
jgi:formylglycine-generating enzyme required for sulfatase activity